MSSTQPFDIQGIKVPVLADFGQYADLQGGTLDTTRFEPWADVFAQARAAGVNNVTLMLSAGVMQNFDDNGFDPSLRYMPDDDTIRALADLVKASGMTVTINLFAHVKNTISGSGGADRPYPTDPALWQQAFGESVLYWAQFAEEVGAVAFTPFTDETQHLFRPRELTPAWLDLIADVKSVYSGILSTGWYTPGHGDSITAIPAAIIEQLDVLGVGFFPNLTTDTDATQAELEAAYRSDENGNDVLQFLQDLAERYDKPVWISDKAFHSFDGAAANEARIFTPSIPLTEDQQEQALLYESFLQVMTEGNYGWLKGVAFQNYNNFVDGTAGVARFLEGPLSESPQHKLAEGVMAGWFQGLRQGEGATLEDGMQSNFVGGGYHHDTLLGGAGSDTLAGAAGNDRIVPGPTDLSPTLGFVVDVTLRGVLADGEMPQVSIRDSHGQLILSAEVTALLDTSGGPQSGQPMHLQFQTDDPGGFTIVETNWAFIDFSPTGNRFVRIEGVTVNGASVNASQAITYVKPDGGEVPGATDSVHGGKFVVTLGGATPVLLALVADDDTVLGGDGIDTVRFLGDHAGYEVARAGDTVVVDDLSGPEGTDTLAGVERLEFADISLAMDLDGNAGSSAKILGAVFGAAAAAVPEYAGIVIDYLDHGISPEVLTEAVLQLRLGAGFSNADLVSLLFHNLAGATPSPSDLAYFDVLLGSGGFTPATLAIAASETGWNLDNIGFATLQAQGLPFDL